MNQRTVEIVRYISPPKMAGTWLHVKTVACCHREQQHNGLPREVAVTQEETVWATTHPNHLNIQAKSVCTKCGERIFKTKNNLWGHMRLNHVTQTKCRGAIPVDQGTAAVWQEEEAPLPHILKASRTRRVCSACHGLNVELIPVRMPRVTPSDYRMHYKCQDCGSDKQYHTSFPLEYAYIWNETLIAEFATYCLRCGRRYNWMKARSPHCQCPDIVVDSEITDVPQGSIFTWMEQFA